MLTFITPRERTHHKEKVETLLNLFKIYQRFELPASLQNKATFLVAENNENGIYGGAVLYPKKAKSLYEKLARGLLKFSPHIEDVWCVRICFSAKQAEGYHTLDTVGFYETFYKEMYESLSEWGKQNNVSFLALTLEYKEYKESKSYGQWPYLLELDFSETSDHKFHGLLVLESQETHPSFGSHRRVQ